MRDTSNVIAIDGHVHLHSDFQVDVFLGSAYANLREAAREFAPSGSLVAVLLLTEGERENAFGRLVTHLNRRNGSKVPFGWKWTVSRTEERVSLCLTSEEDDISDVMVVVAGRQIPTQERLEVLAIGTRQKFKEKLPTASLIQRVSEEGALPVIPWGAGKWWGSRGRLVEELMHSSRLPPFFLGDNGNRPVFWPQPSLFRHAEGGGVKNLPGSDPLPFPGESHRVGSFGVVMDGSLDLRRPAHDLKQRLLDPSTTLHQFGEEETPLRFVRNQLKMQFRKLTR